MRVDRRRFLSAVGATTAAGLAGCSTRDSSASETGSTTSTETSDTTTESTKPSDATTESTTTVESEAGRSTPSRELTIVSQAESVVSFDQRLVRESDGSTVYQDTYTYDPGERLVLDDSFDQNHTYEFEMSVPDGEPVFERVLYPYIVSIEVTIRSATDVERTSITEV